jgi:hypothetical protein
VLDLISLTLPATSGAHCRFTTAPAYYSHRRPISLFRNFRVSLSAITAFYPLPVTPSYRLPSSPLLIPAIKQFVPIRFQSLTFLCFPFSSRPDCLVSQLPPLQNIIQTSWARFVLLLCTYFNLLAVNGLRVLSLLLRKHYPLSHPPEVPPTTTVGLPRVTLRTPPRLISPTF